MLIVVLHINTVLLLNLVRTRLTTLWVRKQSHNNDNRYSSDPNLKNPLMCIIFNAYIISR